MNCRAAKNDANMQLLKTFVHKAFDLLFTRLKSAKDASL